MNTKPLKSLRIAALSFASVSAIALCVVTAVSFAACELASMEEYAEMWADYIYVKDWGIAPTSGIMSVANDGDTITIDPSSAADFVVDLKLDNPEELNYAADVEVLEVAGGGAFFPA